MKAPTTLIAAMAALASAGACQSETPARVVFDPPDEVGTEQERRAPLVQHVDFELPAPLPADQLLVHGIAAYPSGQAGIWRALVDDEQRRLLTERYGLEILEEPLLRPLTGGDCPECTTTCDEVTEVFCQYEPGDPGFPTACSKSIKEQLEEIATNHSSIATFITHSSPSTTAGGRPIYGLQIGNSSGPQLFLFAAQHAHEWTGVGILMEFAREITSRHAMGDDDIIDLLSEVAILIVPVANPDGYAYTHDVVAQGMGARSWRKNLSPDGCSSSGPACSPPMMPCTAGVTVCESGSCVPRGVDLNRNFEATWYDDEGCTSITWEGDSPHDQVETHMLDALMHDYANTTFAVNYHSFGNLVLYPDGVSQGSVGDVREPCRSTQGVSVAGENCQPPEFELLRWMTGSEAQASAMVPTSTALIDPATGEPYSVDAAYRSLYTAAGNQMEHHAYDEPGGESDVANVLSITVETNRSCIGHRAECFTSSAWSALKNEHIDFLLTLASRVPAFEDSESLRDAAGFNDFAGWRIHRLRADADVDTFDNYGPPRAWVGVRAGLTPVTFVPPSGYSGTTDPWNAEGLFYEDYRWTPDTPFVFPGEFTLCNDGDTCGTAAIDDGPVNLCDGSNFITTDDWVFTSLKPGSAPDCYWSLDGSTVGATNVLERKMVVDDPGYRMQFNYSYTMRTNHFAPGGGVDVHVRSSSTPWTLVRQYPQSRRERPLPTASDRLRTEQVDVSFMDGETDIQIRFTAHDTNALLSDETFRIFDVVLTYWR